MGSVLRASALLAWLWCSGCVPQVGELLETDAGGSLAVDGGQAVDGGPREDAGSASSDGGEPQDAGAPDGGSPDAGPPPAPCANGALDPGESDIDCGGSCAPCALGRRCGSAVDCASGVCRGAACVAAAAPCAASFAGCTTFSDLTQSATPTIQFPSGGMRYSPKCVRIRLGQAVQFQGDFGSHPLAQGCGPVPDLVRASGGASKTVTFSEGLGVYGYYCTQMGTASGGGMAGAIEVVP